MISPVPISKLTQQFSFVKPSPQDCLSTSPDTMRHHKVTLSRKGNIMVSYGKYRCKAYDVSSEYRVLTKGLFNKRFDQIVHCLRDVIALPTCEREVTLRLLRFWTYYGQVYPKASQVCSEPGCSKATFWRAVKHLKNLGLIRTIPRFRFSPHAKISSLYRLDRLVLVIARYLAEHGTAFLEKWLKPFLTMPGSHFWPLAFAAARETDFEGRFILPSLVPLESSK